MPKSKEEREREIKFFKIGDKVSFGITYSEFPKDGITEMKGEIIEFINDTEVFIKTKYGILKERLSYISKIKEK